MKTKMFLIFAALLCCKTIFAEGKYIDFSKKTLIIPMLSVSADFQKYILKKGKTKDLEKVKDEIEKYNTAWKDGISQSVYNVTPYEFSTEVNKDEVKAASDKYLYLSFSLIKKRETLRVVQSTKSGYTTILVTLNIVGFNLKNTDDVRRAMNMINSKMLEYKKTNSNQSSELTYMKSKLKDLKTKLKDKTFYFAKFTKEDTKHFEKWNSKMESALKDKWKVSNYKVVTKEELNDMIVNGTDPKGYYMISQKKKAPVGVLIYYGVFFTAGLMPIIYYACPHVTHTVLSTDNEDIKFQFKSYSRYKSGKVLKLQKKLLQKS